MVIDWHCVTYVFIFANVYICFIFNSLNAQHTFINDLMQTHIGSVEVVFVFGSLTPRSHPVDMPKSQEDATVVASTCSSMPYATFIEAAESGRFIAAFTVNRCNCALCHKAIRPVSGTNYHTMSTLHRPKKFSAIT